MQQVFSSLADLFLGTLYGLINISDSAIIIFFSLDKHVLAI